MKFMRFLKWFNRKDMKIAALEAKYGALDIIHSSLVDLYEELREENEELKNNVKELEENKDELQKICIDAENKENELRSRIGSLEMENRKLGNWCRKILDKYGCMKEPNDPIFYNVRTETNIETLTETKITYVPAIRIVEVENMR